MFWHNFWYSLKTLFRDKVLIFWTFAFPLILGTLFYMAFSAISDGEKLSIINIGAVNNLSYQNDEIYRPALETLSAADNSERLFDLTIDTEESLQEKLDQGEIDGFLKISDQQPELTFAKNGINQTIFKYVIEEIASTHQIIEQLADTQITKTHPKTPAEYEKIYQEVAILATEAEPNLREITSSKLDYIMIEYYTLVALTCLYGGILGMVAINQKLANMSNVGKRVAVAPTRKSVVVLSSALAAYTAQLLGLALLFAYTILVLKVDYGEHVGLIVLLSLVGSLAGLALGTCITTLLKISENTKTSILIAISMIGCFFAGMMGAQIKYIIDQNVPLVNAINPAAMITDGFYALYYYGSFGKYWFDVISLVIFAVVLLGISALVLRKQKYDHI